MRLRDAGRTNLRVEPAAKGHFGRTRLNTLAPALVALTVNRQVANQGNAPT